MNPSASSSIRPEADSPSPRDLEVRLLETEAQLAEALETLRAIREGEVDALVISKPDGDQIFTLQGAETPYRWLVEEMNEGALLVSLDGVILFANLRFAHYVGVPLEQIIGSSWMRFFSGSPPFGVGAEAPAAVSGGMKQEFDLLRPAGQRRPVAVSLARMEHQGLEAYSAIVTDLSERKASEEALRSSNAKLREMVAELEHFSYSISHDMRAPLRAMKSFSVMLEANCTACDLSFNRELLGRISAAATRLDQLIEGSLSYAKTVKADISLESVDLQRLLTSLLVMYPNLSSDHADIRIEGTLPVVAGNESALTQVFSNLLGNAVKFVAPGTRPQVRIWSAPPPPPAPDAESVRIWIEDNGIGIPESARSRVFELFHRATRHYEGTGIGLAIVQKIVSRLGGRVGFESEEGNGTRFWLEFRLASQGEETATRLPWDDSPSKGGRHG